MARIRYGYRDRKHALDSSKSNNPYAKGFKKHETSNEHIASCKMYLDKLMKIETLIAKPTEEHRTWLETVFTVIKYFGVNGQPLRGYTENTDFMSGEFGRGLDTYRDLFFKLRPDLLKVAQRLPSNAKCTGHEIQNEVIEVLARMVKHVVAERTRKSKLFAIMMDGCTDKNGEEVIGFYCSLHS